jgi:hypothetical protein
MYKGTLIQDLMAMVDRAEARAEQAQLAEQRELHEIFSMEISITEGNRVLMGAA